MNEKSLTQSQSLATFGSSPSKSVMATPPEVSSTSSSKPKEKLTFRGLPIDYVLSLFHYDPEEGALYWAVPPTKGKSKVGQRIGTISKGYRRVQMRRCGEILRTSEHHLIWLFETGDWPLQELDHIDGNPLNNRFSNLQEVSSAGNKQNMKVRSDNISGYPGVYWLVRANRWQVTVGKNYIGLYRTFEEALKVRLAKEAELGYHPNHGTRS